MAASSTEAEPVVICGGGIMGCATAYYLAKRGVRSLILEATGLARGASGKAGGFLARDWCQGFPAHDLATKGFAMHMELAKEFVECDYRRLDTLAVTAKQEAKERPKECPDWLQQNIHQVSIMGTTQNTAQVNPWKLSNAFFKRAEDMVGTEMRICEVVGFEHDKGHIKGVKLKSGEVIAGSRVLIALGPWCCKLFVRSLGLPRFGFRKAASIIMDEVSSTPHALFMSYSPPSDGEQVDIEWYPRPDGTVYVCGDEAQDPLPDYTSEVHPTDRAIRTIKATVDKVCPGLSSKTKRTQACYMPITEERTPVLGKVKGIEGLYIAAGHAVWGILMAPITGAAMAQLILDGTCTLVNLDIFNPSKRDHDSDSD